MPVIYKKMQYGAQFGYNDNGANFKTDSNNPAIGTSNRNIIFRFSHVGVPKGSTINSANLYLAYSAKNDGDVVTFNHTVYIDGQTPTQWLDTSRAEWNTSVVPGRTWTLPAGAPTVSRTLTQVAGVPRTVYSMNVKTHLDALVVNPAWTLAGGSITFLVSHGSASSPDYTYLSGPNDGYSPLLEIDYTPPASDGKSTVVNLQENAIFNRSTNAAGTFEIAPFGFTDWFGRYTQPTLSVTGSLGTEVTVAPPSGGNMLRVEATTGTPMMHFGVPIIEEGKWWNFSCWTWMPTTAPANMQIGMTLLGDSINSGWRTEKGVWVRHNKPFMMDDGGTWACIETGGSGFTWNSYCVFYMAGVQLTEGKMVRPWIGGNKTLTGADYGWAGITGTNGFVRAAPPTVSVPVQLDKAESLSFPVDWTYAQTNGHAQDSVTVKVRKVM